MDKFDWQCEDMKLMNEKCNLYIGKEKIYQCENCLSREEKISFIDGKSNGAMSYLLNLLNKFNTDKESLCKDRYGCIKTVSLKAWINRNDSEKLIDTNFSIGRITLFYATCFIQDNFEVTNTYSIYKDFVDEVFHRLLKELEIKEKTYFKKIDPYQIALSKLRGYSDKFKTAFGTRLLFSSDGTIKICNENHSREITLNEVNKLIELYEKLEDCINTLTDENNIRY